MTDAEDNRLHKAADHAITTFQMQFGLTRQEARDRFAACIENEEDEERRVRRAIAQVDERETAHD